MLSKRNESGLDLLKFLAALLVIANHTSPLLSFNPYADFLLSGLVSRIAVPVFFLTSGFFYFRKLSGEPRADKKALLRYSKKIGKLYAIAIVLYLPLNVYTGYFSNHFTAYSFIKDIVFDGTFYHLWYLPALLIGIGMTSFMHKLMSMKAMLAAAGFLYIIGLLGDSYYGMIENTEGISRVYEVLFTIFDYTRNGLFYAPVYLALGAWAAKRKEPVRRPITNACLFAVSLAMLLAEGILLHAAGIPRHDSMFIFALPAAYFSFQWALQWRGRTRKALREGRVWIYILHPLAIVFVRGLAKTAKLESLFITNSLLHFVAVCLLSIMMAAAAVRLSAMKFNFRR